MTKVEKLRLKLAQATKTFMFSDLITVLSQLGYEMYERAGSRVVFVNEQDGSNRIHLHKPHPENTIKGGALKAVKTHLREKGYFDDILTDEKENNDDDL